MKIDSQAMNVVARGLFRVSPVVHMLGFHPTCNRVVNGIAHDFGESFLDLPQVKVCFYRLFVGLPSFESLTSRWVDSV